MCMAEHLLIVIFVSAHEDFFNKNEKELDSLTNNITVLNKRMEKYISIIDNRRLHYKDCSSGVTE